MINELDQFLTDDILLKYTNYLRMNYKEATTKTYSWAVKRYRKIRNSEDKYVKHSRDVINALRKFVRWLKQNKMISRELMQDLLESEELSITKRAVKKVRYAIPPDQYEKVIAQGPGIFGKMILWLGLTFGLRRGEIIHLRIQDIDFNSKILKIQEHKPNGKIKTFDSWSPKHNVYRELPFSNESSEILKEFLKQREIILKERMKKTYTFKDKEFDYKNRDCLILTNVITASHVKADTLSIDKTMVNSWLEKVKFKLNGRYIKVRPHFLRYSFAYNNYIKSGYNIHLVSKLLGHKKVSTTSDYLDVAQEQYIDQARELL